MQFIKESIFAASIEEVWAFHERADAFELLQPPWETSDIIQPPTSLEVGTEVILRAKVGPAWVKIVARHVAYERGRMFEDHMVEGPFAKWEHKHLFTEHPEGALLRDEIEYEPPLGILGRIANPVAVLPRLKKLFAYRHDVTRRHVEGA